MATGKAWARGPVIPGGKYYDCRPNNRRLLEQQIGALYWMQDRGIPCSNVGKSYQEAIDNCMAALDLLDAVEFGR